jgi:hypothetical protein
MTSVLMGRQCIAESRGSLLKTLYIMNSLPPRAGILHLPERTLGVAVKSASGINRLFTMSGRSEPASWMTRASIVAEASSRLS